ncbi:MAG: hypothetical protein HZA88_01060 [Verrucomicrobia bacterium]|nr:hypothetical protein [Verrucomicrobiota bacterium]
MEPTLTAETRQIWRRLAWLGVYAIAMGLLEAVCVIYLRRLFPVESYFPIPPLEKMPVEIPREACTIIMLAAVAWLTGINWRSRLACFFFAFGIWDILYYVGLRWWTGWPGALLTWDCLFLIPKPWYGPVLAPVLISVYFVGACCWLHVHEVRGRPVRWSFALVASQLLAFAVWYWSFVKDAERITGTGYKGVSYSWELFAVGTLIAIAGLWLAKRMSRPAAAIAGATG